MSKFKVGDKVRCIEAQSYQYIKVGDIYTIKGILDDSYVKLDEITEIHDYCEDKFELVEAKQPTSYREMSPDSTVKVKIGDYEFDCPIKELLIIDALSGNIVSEVRTSTFFYNIEKALDTDSFGLIGICSDEVEILNSEDFYQEYFKPFYDKQEEKDLLLKDIEEQKTILKNQQEFLKELEDKYSSLN